MDKPLVRIFETQEVEIPTWRAVLGDPYSVMLHEPANYLRLIAGNRSRKPAQGDDLLSLRSTSPGQGFTPASTVRRERIARQRIDDMKQM